MSHIYISLLLILASLNLKAETSASEHFDFLKASEAAMKAQKFSGALGVLSPEQCKPLKSIRGDSVLSCAVTDEEIDNNVIVKTNEFPEGAIPDAIKNVLPQEFLNDVQNKKVTCVFNFRLANDNQQLFGCKGPNQYSGPGVRTIGDKCGDDWGYTHGLKVGLSCTSADGLSQTFTYSTDLFSDPNRSTRRIDKNGISHMDQKFISENIFSFIQDSANKGELTYWRRGIGFVNLSSKKKWGMMQSTGQQEWFHDVRNRANPGEAMNYNYVEGSTDKWGAFVMLGTGLQASKELGSYCKVSGSAEVGARLSTLKDSNLIYGSLNGKFGVTVGEGQIYARAGYDLTRRPSSTVGESTLALGYERKSGTKVEVGLRQQNGNRRDVPDTPNLVAQTNRGIQKNDKILFLEFSYSH